jgi:hypothetical protein
MNNQDQEGHSANQPTSATPVPRRTFLRRTSRGLLFFSVVDLLPVTSALAVDCRIYGGADCTNNIQGDNTCISQGDQDEKCSAGNQSIGTFDRDEGCKASANPDNSCGGNNPAIAGREKDESCQSGSDFRIPNGRDEYCENTPGAFDAHNPPKPK